jgi:hypothetical protein
MDRRSEFAGLAEKVGRSAFFLEPIAGKLFLLGRSEYADQVSDAYLKLMELRVELVKLSRHPAPAPAQDDLGEPKVA